MTLATLAAAILGLVVCFFLLSTIASTVNEAIELFWKRRASTLKTTIIGMVDGDVPGSPGLETLGKKVFGHSLVSGLIPGRAKPSYVPARNFTKALLEILLKGSDAPVLVAIQTAVNDLPDGALRSSLLPLLRSAGHDIDALEHAIGQWYDDVMDRASGVYKRNNYVFLFVIGFICAVVLNVNAVAIFNSISISQGKVSEINTMAAQIAAGSSGNSKELTDQLSATVGNLLSVPVPLGWRSCTAAISVGSQGAGTKAQPASTSGAPLSAPAPLPPQTTPACVPVGWGDYTVDFGTSSLGGVLAKIVGWLLTALAVAQGAPFWFDLLGHLVNLRAAGPKPGKGDRQAS